MDYVSALLRYDGGNLSALGLTPDNRLGNVEQTPIFAQKNGVAGQGFDR